MKHGLQDIEWSYIGAKLAVEDDIEQIKFFKAFIKECLSWGTVHQAEFQLAGISLGLTKEEKEILSQIVYIEGGD